MAWRAVAIWLMLASVAVAGTINSQPSLPGSLVSTDAVPAGRVGAATAYKMTVGQIKAFLFGTPIDGSINGQAILGVTPGYTTITEAITTAAGASRTVFMQTGTSVTANLVVPATLELVPLNGAVITHGAYTVTVNSSTARWPLAQVFDGTGTVTFGTSNTGPIRPVWLGDDLAKAVAAAYAGSTIRLENATYTYASTAAITVKNLTIEGVSSARNGGGNYGSQITFNGTGPAFQLGTDNGSNWDANQYDGITGFKLKNVALKHGTPDTPLAGGTGSYKAGSYGIRDWRGGSIVLENVMIEQFEYNFWGVQSDVNTFRDVLSIYSKYGLYFGPRSDQQSIYNLYSFYCDTAISIDRANSVRFYHPIIVSCGSASTYAVNIKKGAGTVSLSEPWFEYFGNAGPVPAFVAAGLENGYLSGNPTGQTSPAKGFTITDPFIYTSNTGADHTKYMVEVGSCLDINISTPNSVVGVAVNNLDALIAFTVGVAHTGATSNVHYDGQSGMSESKIFLNNGTGTPAATYILRSPNVSANETVIGSAATSTSLAIKALGANTGAEYLRINQSNVAGAVLFQVPTYATGQTNRLKLRKSWQHESAMPTSGTYEQGDIVWNMSPTELGAASAKYILTDWFEMRALTGN